MQPTPLRGPEIGAFLQVGISQALFRSIAAARLSGNPLGYAQIKPRQFVFLLFTPCGIVIPKEKPVLEA